MYKAVIIVPIIFFLFTVSACHKEIKSDKGGIDLISNVYFEASKGLDHVQNFHLSRINYLGDTIIELIPDLTFPEITTEIYYIKDSLYYPLGKENNSSLLAEISKKQKPLSLEKKNDGALFSKDWIPNYLHRKNLNDTVLFNKKYKRFEVISDKSFARYYIYPTDTILPYTIYHHAEIDYRGRLERIDSYNKEKDIFVTLQLLPRKKWDNEAQDIFEFNEFAKNKKR